MPKLSCSRCKSPLRQEEASNLPALVCDACGGVWLDNLASQRIVESLEVQIASLSRDLAYSAPKRPPSSCAAACPVCGADMGQRTVAGSIVVDVCAEHGTWFDAGELHGVIDALHPPKPLPEFDDELLQRELDTWSQAGDDGLVATFWKIVKRLPSRTIPHP